MTISSRTPEGIPHRCPVRGSVVAVDPSFPDGDSICPRRGHLPWWFRDRLGGAFGLQASLIQLDSSFRDDLNAESLDVIELMTAFEEEFDVIISDDEVERLRTVEDVIRFWIRYRGEAA